MNWISRQFRAGFQGFKERTNVGGNYEASVILNYHFQNMIARKIPIFPSQLQLVLIAVTSTHCTEGVSVKRGPDTCEWRMRMGKCE